MTDNERKLLRIHHTLPCKGLNGYGQGKHDGCCPHCGADHTIYYFDGRWKRCEKCGFDRLCERQFMAWRWALRQGRPVHAASVTNALQYGIKVYGDPDKPNQLMR